MKSDGKTEFYKQGLTKDIVKACILQWRDYWTQCMNFAVKYQSDDIRSTCENLFNFIVTNIRYEEDPKGKQWIKSPARLLADGFGDCKSFSIFIASCLDCLGINVVMRFVSYDNTKEYTHVYPVAFDESDNPIIIDAVAMIQKKVLFNNEIKFKHKIDMSRSTEISRLSGVGYTPNNEPDATYAVNQGDMYGNLDIPEELPKITFTEEKKSDVKLYQNYLSALINYIDALIYVIDDMSLFNLSMLYRHIKEMCKPHYTSSELQVVAYVFASHIENGSYSIPVSSTNDLRGISRSFGATFQNIQSEIENYLSSNQEYTVSIELEELQRDFLAWFSQQIMSRNFVKEGNIAIEDFLPQFTPTALYFLYTVIDDSQLSDIARQKKAGALDQLAELISDVSSLDVPTALLIVSAEIIRQTYLTADQINEGLRSSAIGSVDWDKIFEGVTTAANAFATIWQSTRKNNNSGGNNAPNSNDYIPWYGGGGSILSNPWVIGAGALFGGVLIYKIASKPKRGKK